MARLYLDFRPQRKNTEKQTSGQLGLLEPFRNLFIYIFTVLFFILNVSCVMAYVSSTDVGLLFLIVVTASLAHGEY